MHKVEVNSLPDGETLPKELRLDNIILYGPPGTGKTYTVQTEYISKFKDNLVTTFHQAFSYEEFVEGLKPILVNEDGSTSQDGTGDIKYKVVKGIFREACERAAELAGYASLAECLEDTKSNRVTKFNKAIEEKKTVLLCIDEINRGNVASIFGDLISLIEPSKRLGAGELEMTAILPYSKTPFGVPANLFIVGTMNTADRSIQLLDSALRRRFKFEELQPKYEVIKDTNARMVLKTINARVRCLLNKDNQIGHSYLMFANSYCDILSALYNKIIPLLEEYFYNDINKVRFVLNDNTNSQFYIEDTEAKAAYQLYLNEEVDEEERKFFKLDSAIADAIDSKDEIECAKYLVNLLPKKE
jgi:5-methylcytosine-specific restriction protein B